MVIDYIFFFNLWHKVRDHRWKGLAFLFYYLSLLYGIIKKKLTISNTFRQQNMLKLTARPTNRHLRFLSGLASVDHCVKYVDAWPSIHSVHIELLLEGPGWCEEILQHST